MSSEIAQSNEYQSFRSSVSQRKVSIEKYNENELEGSNGGVFVDEDESKEWKVYDAGPRSVKCPLICFPPASGTADVFFRQILALTAVGYRVISVEYPTYWKIVEFCEGFRRLIDHLQLDKVHLFGASLGGFLAQKFAEYTYRSPRVASLILCNSFYDTTIFNQTNSAPTFWMMPSLVLKKMVMGNFDKGPVDPSICDSIDFLVEKLDGLTQAELASRLTLNCMNCYVEPQKIQQIPITIMDVFDDCALSHSRAHLKSGGNFPYLSRCDEVDIFIKIHLQPFDNKKYSAKEYVKAEED
ncbi:SPG21 [Mytilus coruscus]|uniref:Maspardin n=1 Tax=Mytilus coruscus TaxID=42192 RepID=A0A6J8CFV3_MYTCO|nr:SPG21 [Mytilus coruscus]